MANIKYLNYLKSAEWQEIRLHLIEKRNWTCERCGKQKKRLQIHHLTYDRLYNEKESDLMVVCPSCHHDIHFPPKPKKQKPDKKKNLLLKAEQRLKQYQRSKK